MLACRFAATLSRPLARQVIRQAVCDDMLTVAQAAGLCWLPEQLVLHGTPGQPPWLQHPPLSGVGGAACFPARTFLSFSHQPGYALAALSRTGPVGVDLMRVEALPDWRELADDYLSPEVSRRLAGLPPDGRDRAFAVAWTCLEAGLKCLGQPLTEWTPVLAARLAALHTLPLDLPAGWVGTLAVPDAATFSGAVPVTFSA